MAHIHLRWKIKNQVKQSDDGHRKSDWDVKINPQELWNG